MENLTGTVGDAHPNTDYLSRTGNITFAPGETSKPIAVPIVGDQVFEYGYLGLEDFKVRLTNVFGTPPEAHIFIRDNDQPRVSIEDASAYEGDRLVFKVRLDKPVPYPVEMQFDIEGGTVTGEDYAVDVGENRGLDHLFITIAPNQTEFNIVLTALNDRIPGEEPETIKVRLLDPSVTAPRSPLLLGRDVAQGTIYERVNPQVWIFEVAQSLPRIHKAHVSSRPQH